MDLKKWMYDKKSVQFKSKNSKFSQHNKSHRIAFLFDGREDANLKLLKAYTRKLQEAGKDVNYLFLTDHADPEQISFQAFNKKAFNWYNIPTAHTVLDFIDKDFDVLICFNTDDLKEFNSIMDLSNAKFKVGIMHGHSEIYNLVINPQQGDDWYDHLAVLERTLGQLSMETVIG